MDREGFRNTSTPQENTRAHDRTGDDAAEHLYQMRAADVRVTVPKRLLIDSDVGERARRVPRLAEPPPAA